jgi:hypothetical protein
MTTILSACGKEDGAQVSFVLTRVNDNSSGLNSLRAMLDRDHVTKAICEVMDNDKRPLVMDTVEITSSEQQEHILTNIPEGSGYFARIKGLEVIDGNETVYECGVTGPFDLVAGKKHFVSLVIHYPLAGDPACSNICQTNSDCEPAGECLSPCASDPSKAETNPEQNCTMALCSPN